MGLHIKRCIGQILIDGGFIKKIDLARAVEEQKHTSELLGQVLIRMKALKARDISAPLLIQDCLSSIDDAVKIEAGEQLLLGALQVQFGHITSKQLDHAIAEQKRSGDKLGEVFTRLGMLTEHQLEALREFQHKQADTTISNPLRLGELLVASGYLSHEQLDDALLKQSVSHKKIGEVLVEEGHISPRNLKSGCRLQKMLVKSVLTAILSLGLRAPAMAESVSLQWNPNTDSNLAGYKVYYTLDSSTLSTATPIDVGLQTAASINGLDPGQSYQFAITAYDTAGAESSFSNIVTLAEQVPPNVGITSPLNSTNVSGVVTVSASASDNVGVTKVEFYINDVLKVTEAASPYTFSWDTSTVAPGTYTLMAKAYDAAGNVTQSSSTVNVVSDITPPKVTMTSPANNATLSGTVTISSSASDNVGVSLVEFYCNGVLLYSSNMVPYSYSWDTTTVANGNYAIVAIAHDNAGNITQSSSVTVTVNNGV
ncbi:MAG TPA: Ig-like domain-containing protein, partial [Geobacteraceae bacterium]|nr:Ig-like domain-containing protein [Geobacteraceae bacterium]